VISSIAAIIFSIYAVFSFFILIGFRRIPESQLLCNNLPTVSILITCRNEEKDLPTCLDSLSKLSYPKELLQVVLIDDNSTDSTLHILNEFSDQHEHVLSFSAIDFAPTHLEAKARGISRAVSKANGEWLFITDADGIVPNHWIQHMLDGVTNNTGLIVATTETLSPTFVGKLEKIIGAYTIPIGWGLAGWGFPINALGPNMAIRKSVYEKYGGLEKADFKVAEDQAMFNLVNKNGYDIVYHMDKHTKIKLNPVQSLKHIISQQRRWIKGGFEGNSLEKLLISFLLLLGFSFSIFTFWIIFFLPIYGIGFAMIKLVMDTLIYWQYGKRTEISELIVLSPVSFIYTLVAFLWIPATFIFKRDIAWMGDGYKVKYE
jgi:cellulose synthase/poly-beta-1,6-N-acetylglucosamine synthase-like glycosyltransferase